MALRRLPPSSADARKHLLGIFAAALRRADPAPLVSRVLRPTPEGLAVGELSLVVPGRVVLLAAGKAAVAMATGARTALGSRVGEALIIAPEGAEASQLQPDGWQHVLGGHPLPDVASLRAGEMAFEMARALESGDLLLCLISGGASALMERPLSGVTLDEIVAATRDGIATGATIQDLNRRRRRLSSLKGGGLSDAAAPAMVVGLVLSDVVGDSLLDVGSGPTVGGDRGGAHNVLVGDNRLLIDGASRAARELGYAPTSLGRAWTGEAREVGARLAGHALNSLRQANSRRCLLAAGESTVSVRGDGLGGRNQEVALGAALALDGVNGVWFCSAGSDGRDGPTPAAGAMADGATVARGRTLGLDASASLTTNDSWPFFDALGDHVITGPTGTNLMDLQIILIEGESR